MKSGYGCAEKCNFLPKTMHDKDLKRCKKISRKVAVFVENLYDIK